LNSPARLAVFASGGGTNLQALLEHFNGRGSSLARVELVVASRPGVGALARAQRAGVATCVIASGPGGPAATAGAMLNLLDSHHIDLIVLAGYLKLVPEVVVDRFRSRILNIHPALLPGFGGAGMYGLRVHAAVLASGVRVSGATVHLVDEHYDQGSIVAQWPVPVLPGDTPERLAARVLEVEHLLLPAAIEALLTGGPAGEGVVQGAFEWSDAAAPSEWSVRRLIR
jgi:phosphoribosylglycinamide formyltransferase 1